MVRGEVENVGEIWWLWKKSLDGVSVLASSPRLLQPRELVDALLICSLHNRDRNPALVRVPNWGTIRMERGQLGRIRCGVKTLFIILVPFPDEHRSDNMLRHER